MSNIKKAALRTLAATVLLGVALSILAILHGTWTLFEVRIIWSTFTISGASILALACAAVLERDERNPVPILGVALSVAAAILVIATIWSSSVGPDLARLTFTTVVFAVALGHVSLLSLARLARRHTWALVLAYVSILGLATWISLILWAEMGGMGAIQLLGVLAILDAGASILVPIFHVLSRSEVTIGDSVLVLGPVRVTCPCCGKSQTHSLGRITCQACGGVFAVSLIQKGRLAAR